MSKIGKKNITIPKDSSVKSENGIITITGPKGSKQLTINDKIFSAKVNENNEFNIMPIATKNIDKKTSVMWGTYRSLINNAVLGVSTGHQKILDITGVGFRANLKGEILNLQLGFSHDINFKIPKDVKIVVEKQTIITITGIDKELVSKVASDIKTFKPVEPYKGKGIRERGQFVLRKEGKKK
jgi:large subunit ribosomal protein L6|tara:strand:- start:1424 stop:1972 length:549 start_codon:yes stop_codon:yes gene_type:complete